MSIPIRPENAFSDAIECTLENNDDLECIWPVQTGSEEIVSPEDVGKYSKGSVRRVICAAKELRKEMELQISSEHPAVDIIRTADLLQSIDS